MPLLRVDPSAKPNIFKLQLDGNTAARLRRYSRFTHNGTLDSIIKAALNYCFDADKDFVAWEENPENLLEPDRPKRKARANQNGSAPSAAASGPQGEKK